MGSYWLVLLYRDEEKARRCFRMYEERGVPVLLFESQAYPPEYWLVCAYAPDSLHQSVGYPPAEDAYAGLLRVRELLHRDILCDAGNFGTKNVDEVIGKALCLIDQL